MLTETDLINAMRRPKDISLPTGGKKKGPSMQDAVSEFELDDDGEKYIGVGIDGLLASTEKLLAVNRGMADPDERDSMKFQKIMRPHSLLRESIKMDAGKVARGVMYQAARRKSLQGLSPGTFDSYVERLISGNPLTSPLEEINPMQLTENARRITRMGPGGLGSDESITEEAQAVHPTQYGFISTLEGPESGRAGIDVRIAMGVKVGNNGRLYQKMLNRRTGKLQWVCPDDLDGASVKFPD